MTPFLTLVLAGMLARLGYQMARSPVLPRFAQDLGASPELIGLIFAASTITGIFIKLPAGALSDLFGRKRMLLVGCLFFAGPPSLYPRAEAFSGSRALSDRPFWRRVARSYPGTRRRRPHQGHPTGNSAVPVTLRLIAVRGFPGMSPANDHPRSTKIICLYDKDHSKRRLHMPSKH